VAQREMKESLSPEMLEIYEEKGDLVDESLTVVNAHHWFKDSFVVLKFKSCLERPLGLEYRQSIAKLESILSNHHHLKYKYSMQEMGELLLNLIYPLHTVLQDCAITLDEKETLCNVHGISTGVDEF
jgi:hypothetical protein